MHLLDAQVNIGKNMSVRGSKVFMVGAFPPPVHGMAAVNEAVRAELEKSGAALTIIDTSAKNLKRSFGARFGRIFNVLKGLFRLMFSSSIQGAKFYMSVSGSFGQVYEILFLLIARSRNMQIYLHHHCFSYIDSYSFLTKFLFVIASPNSVHITLSKGMANSLRQQYSLVNKIVSISNAVFFPSYNHSVVAARTSLTTIGFMSNIAKEKGIFQFLDLISMCNSQKIPIQAKVAGPFQDKDTEKEVMKQLSVLSNIEYLGPLYGQEKVLFYDTIDVLVFPTSYINEAEPLTIHEAMQCAIPVIAYGRGSISEIVTCGAGLVIRPELPFVTPALNQIQQWVQFPEVYNKSSCAALEMFGTTLENNKDNWESLLAEIVA